LSNWTVAASDAAIIDAQCRFLKNAPYSDVNACLNTCETISGCNAVVYSDAQKICNLNRCNTFSPSITKNGYQGYISLTKKSTG
ncbi:unnamed protein product, partial [Adineta steineri]